MRIPTRRRPELALLAAVAALAGCGDGGGPHLARADAAPLIALSHKISREGACAQARDIPTLQHQTEALLNARRVPAALAESLLSGVNALTEQTPVCLPAIPTTTTTTQPVVEPPPARKHEHHEKHHKDEHKGKHD